MPEAPASTPAPFLSALSCLGMFAQGMIIVKQDKKRFSRKDAKGPRRKEEREKSLKFTCTFTFTENLSV